MDRYTYLLYYKSRVFLTNCLIVHLPVKLFVRLKLITNSNFTVGNIKPVSSAMQSKMFNVWKYCYSFLGVWLFKCYNQTSLGHKNFAREDTRLPFPLKELVVTK